MKKARFENILDLVGQTPIVRLQSPEKLKKHQFFAKLEYLNPSGSVKDRLGQALIAGAEKRGELKPGGTIVEATSGNTGLGIAMAAAVKGYKCIFVMPEKVSTEKRAILRAYGAKVVICPNSVDPEDPRGYIQVSLRIAKDTPGSFYANQYHNPDNFKVHEQTTGPEIWQQMEEDIDVLVGGMGTGGTLSGCASFLKQKSKNIKIVCADPVGSILYDLFYHKKIVTPPAPYKVEGVGEDMLPDNVRLNLMDAMVQVNDQEAFGEVRKLVLEQGICVGPSCALALVAAYKYAEKLETPAKILVIFPDSGRAYLSKAFNDQWMQENGFLNQSEIKNSFNREVFVDEEYPQ